MEWAHFLWFEKHGKPAKLNFKNSNDIDSETITISVKNKGFFKDELIGSFTMGVSSIYFRDKHACEH